MRDERRVVKEEDEGSRDEKLVTEGRSAKKYFRATSDFQFFP